jgi:hypothetical protein
MSLARHDAAGGETGDADMKRGRNSTIAKIVLLALTLAASAPAVAAANAPGGAYVQCDPHNPSAPIRCNADGW